MKTHYQIIFVVGRFFCARSVTVCFSLKATFTKAKRLPSISAQRRAHCTISGAGFSRSIWVSIFPASRT